MKDHGGTKSQLPFFFLHVLHLKCLDPTPVWAPSTSFWTLLVPSISIKPCFLILDSCIRWGFVLLGRWSVHKVALKTSYLLSSRRIKRINCCFTASSPPGEVIHKGCYLCIGRCCSSGAFFLGFTGLAAKNFLVYAADRTHHSFRMSCFLEKPFICESRAKLDEWVHASKGLQWRQKRSSQKNRLEVVPPSWMSRCRNN